MMRTENQKFNSFPKRTIAKEIRKLQGRCVARSPKDWSVSAAENSLTVRGFLTVIFHICQMQDEVLQGHFLAFKRSSHDGNGRQQVRGFLVKTENSNGLEDEDLPFLRHSPAYLQGFFGLFVFREGIIYIMNYDSNNFYHL